MNRKSEQWILEIMKQMYLIQTEYLCHRIWWQEVSEINDVSTSQVQKTEGSSSSTKILCM